MLGLLKNKQFLHATAILIGTMVGVGIFGIPFSFAKAGFWIGFLFLVLIALVTLFLNYIYGEIILRTQQSHQIVGYTEFYLGSFWKKIIFFSIVLNTYAALLAYIITAGDFWSNALSSFLTLSPGAISIWFFAIVSIIVFFGIRTVAWVELCLAILFMAVISLIFGFGVGKINFSNFNYINPDFWFLPYGIMLFAFGGLTAIPIQRRILSGQEDQFKRSIALALFFVGALYLIFGFTVFGISGEATSPTAIEGLISSIGGKIMFLASLFGGLAVSTSFIMLGTGLMQIFALDYGLNKKISWLLVVFPPLALFLGGLKNFVDVIGLGGGIGVGLEAFVLIWVFVRAKSKGDRVPEYSISVPAWALYALALVFLGGMVYTLFVRS